jgi:hypothetical protein
MKFLNHLNNLLFLANFKNYGDTFIRKIKQKHTVARNYFSKLPGISEYMRKLELRGDIYFPPLAGVAISQK